MKKFRRLLAALGILAVLTYVGAMVWLVTQETRLVFRAGAQLGGARPTSPWEQVAAPPAWIIPARGADTGLWVIYFHGNASDIAARLNILHYERLRELGLNVLAPEYRGFGGIRGVPTEAGLDEDATRAYAYLRNVRHIDARRIVIYGWSLGSAVAVTLASRVEEAAVILEGAPASIVEIGQQRYPYFPVRLLIHNPFESILRIDKIGAPVLFLHSSEDEVVPITEARRLFEAAPQPKQFVEVSGGHEYASEKDPRFFPAIRTFLQGLQLVP
jgi:fermentation-respiration switch protein FrsA (DUF1100 family)